MLKMKCISQISFLQKASIHSASLAACPPKNELGYKLPNLIKAKLARERKDKEG